MLHTTFVKAREAGACVGSYRKFAKFKGSVPKWGKYTPFPLTEVLEVCGLADALWCLRCTVEPSEDIRIEFACRCAEHVLHIYEDKYPDDKRPRKAIEAARACITEKSAAAADAAWAAADAADAAWAAADAADAAWAAADAARADAARDAEREWQIQTFRELLNSQINSSYKGAPGPRLKTPGVKPGN